MKMLIFNPEPSLLDRLLARSGAGRNVVIPCYQTDELIRLTAATEPQLVVLRDKGMGATCPAMEKRLRVAGFGMPVIVCDGPVADEMLDALWRKLQASCRDYSKSKAGVRNSDLLMEESIELRSTVAEVRGGDFVKPEERFLALLAAAQFCHQNAANYLAVTKSYQAKNESLWTAGVVAQDASAYLWRAELFRHVSVLAHFVPGVEIDCLPLPQPLSQKHDYLSKAISGEALYAMQAVRAFGICTECDRALWRLGQIQTTVNPNPIDVAVQLAGWTGIVHEIASATTHTLGCYLANSRVRPANGPRAAYSIFCRFWKLDEFLQRPNSVRRLATEFHRGRRAVGVEAFLSFYEFCAQVQQAMIDNSRN